MEMVLEKVTKRWPGVLALDGLDLRHAGGGLVALLGLNGAGKTTLLHVLSAVAVPDEGRVLYDGHPLGREAMDLRQRLHFTPDLPLLFGERSVAENVVIHAEAHGREIDENAVAQLAADLEVGHLARSAAGRLSRGEAYKAGLLCAFAAAPDLWLVDEPFASGMDAVGLGGFRRLARGMAAKGGTVVFTTQIPSLAVEVADHVWLLDRGRLVFDASSAEAREELLAGDSELWRRLAGGTAA